MTGRWSRSEREQEIESIQEAYQRYRQRGRYRLWDAANRGVAHERRSRMTTLTKLIRASLPKGGMLLDLGCGEGAVAEELIPQVAGVEWTGVDVRPDAVAAATARVSGGSFVTASADHLPHPDDWFDMVLAVLLFSSLPSASFEAAVATEIRRVLRPGGWLVFYDARIDNPSNPAIHGISRSRLSTLFRGWPTDLRTVTLLPPLARRLGVLTPMAYPLLEAIPILRTHLVGRLQRPVD